MSTTDKEYLNTLNSNIAVHSKMADQYNTIEPHFKAENVDKVRKRLQALLPESKERTLLDLGCGTGFIIDIARESFSNIIGVDITDAMLEKVDLSGPATIKLLNADTGSVKIPSETVDVVTAYSFLHHLYDIRPTLMTAYSSLKSGGKFYADLDPNFYFWDGIRQLSREKSYDPIVNREIEMTIYKDEDIERQFGVGRDTFNHAEYGKNIKGGFKEDELKKALEEVGFKEVVFLYHWFLGQGSVINEGESPRDERLKLANSMEQTLLRVMPLSRSIFKYMGFIATK